MPVAPSLQPVAHLLALSLEPESTELYRAHHPCCSPASLFSPVPPEQASVPGLPAAGRGVQASVPVRPSMPVAPSLEPVAHLLAPSLEPEPTELNRAHQPCCSTASLFSPVPEQASAPESVADRRLHPFFGPHPALSHPQNSSGLLVSVVAAQPLA